MSHCGRPRHEGIEGGVEMAGCQDFEIAVEKRLHGALREPEQAPLEEHLARCERCRAYQAAACGAEAGMRAEASATAAEMNWERLERGIRGGVPAFLRNGAGAVLAGFWVAAAAWLSAPPEFRPERMIRVLPTAAIVVVLVALVAGYSGRRLVAFVGRGEMLGTYRQVVAENLQWARRMQWAIAALLAFFLYRALTGQSATYDPLVYFGGLSLPLAGLWVFLRHLKVPRADREVRDLGPGEGPAT